MERRQSVAVVVLRATTKVGGGSATRLGGRGGVAVPMPMCDDECVRHEK